MRWRVALALAGALALVAALWLMDGERAPGAAARPADVQDVPAVADRPSATGRPPRIELTRDVPDAPHRADELTSIEGFLERSEGPWTADTLPGFGELVLTLTPRSEDGDRAGDDQRVTITGVGGSDGTWRLAFQAEVPTGTWSLRLVDTTGRRWTPAERRVTTPASDVTFLRLPEEDAVPVVIELVDATDGRPLEDLEGAHVTTVSAPGGGLALRAGNLEERRFGPDARFEWSVWSGDHAASFGSERDLEFQGERWFGRVALQAGWSMRLLVYGPDEAWVAGALVRCDGIAVGRTDADGSLVVRLEQEPAVLTVLAPGLSLPGNPLTRGVRANAGRRGHVLLVRMEEESE